MSVSSQELVKITSPQQELGAMLPDAFYSRDELETLPLEACNASINAANFVCNILSNHLKEPVTPAEGWQAATTFLAALKDAAEEKEIWNGEYVYRQVEEKLDESLNVHNATPETASMYLSALITLVRPGKFHYSLYNRGISRPIAMNHHMLRHEADEETQQTYKTFLNNPATIAQLGDIIQEEELNYYDEDLDQDIEDGYEIGRDVCEDVLVDLGIEGAQACIETWGYPPETGKHLKVIAELEKERPGAVALLHDFYGISQFGRYAARHLARQYDTHGDTSYPYGIHIKAESDWNKAFSRYKAVDAALLEFEDEGNYLVRSIESKSSRELYKRIAALDRLYGNAQKISFAAIEAHGTPELMNLDDRLDVAEALGSLTIRHNYGTTRKWFIDNPTIFLCSCSTGQEQGIAQYLSQKLHATVTGPEKDAGVESLMIVQDSSQVKFEFVHVSGEWLKGEPVMYPRVALYIDGERIESGDSRYKNYFAEAKKPQYLT